MNYGGRQIDPIELWGNYVEFPPHMRRDDTFTPLVCCPNPEHDTLKRHFQINLRQPTVHCFARCGISGHYEHAIAMIEGLYEKFKVDEASGKERDRRTTRARRQARKIILAQVRGVRAGSTPARRSSSPRPAPVVRPEDLHYETFLPQVALEFLHNRGISSDSIATWRIGWHIDEHRIVIPAHDENLHLRFLIKRALRPKDWPKYLYTAGFERTSLLFGAGFIDLGMVQSHGLILTEGSFDTIRLHQHGLANATGILGTGLSEQQRRTISRMRPKRIYFFFDKDAAGVVNIEIAARLLRKYPLYVVRYPAGRSDPAELTKREAFRQIDRAISIHRTTFNANSSERKFKGATQKKYDTLR